MGEERVSREELLERAKKPAAESLRLHKFYRGKTQTTLRCCVRDFDDLVQ